MQRAAALAFLGDKLSAEEAAHMGLIFRAVADDSFEQEVQALATRLSHMPTRGLGLTKKAFNAGWEADLSAHLTTERDLQMEASETEDYAEGVAAFLKNERPTSKDHDTEHRIATVDQLPQDDHRLHPRKPGVSSG